MLAREVFQVGGLPFFHYVRDLIRPDSMPSFLLTDPSYYDILYMLQLEHIFTKEVPYVP